MKTELRLSFRRWLSPQKTHFLSLLLITPAHLASLPVALPPHCYLATGGSTFEWLSRTVGAVFFFLLPPPRRPSCSPLICAMVCVRTCDNSSRPPLFPSLSLVPSSAHSLTRDLATAQTFHHCAGLMESIWATERGGAGERV